MEILYSVVWLLMAIHVGGEFYCLQNCTCAPFITKSTYYNIFCKEDGLREPTVTDLTVKRGFQAQCTQEINWYKRLPLSSHLRFMESIMFYNCTIPPNGSFTSMMSSLGVGDTKELKIYHTSTLVNNTLDLMYFDKIPNLEKLILGYNDVESIDGNVFKVLPNLTQLTLENNSNLKLTNNPFKYLTKLRILILENNKLTINHQSFQKLLKLQHLYLQRNQLVNLESGIFDNLKNLGSLQLSFNKLENLPKRIFYHLEHLKNLTLDHNNLEDIPKNLFVTNTYLAVITINNNENLTTLPKNLFSNLPYLKSALLGHCKLTSLPMRLFTGCVNLQTIELQFNNISLLPKYIFQNLRKLTTLDLTNNEITVLPDGIFSTLSSLEMVKLSYNKITHLHPTIFSKLNRLQKLYLNNNQIDILFDEIFSKLVNLQFLDLSDNNITSLTDKLFDSNYKLKSLNFQNNKLTSITQNTFSSQEQLETINLDNNAITFIHWDSFSKTDSLQNITLAYNYFDLPKTDTSHNSLFFFNLHLAKIDLSHNNITSITGDFFLNKMKPMEVNLSYNGINYFQFSDLLSAHLQAGLIMDLSYNNIIGVNFTHTDWSILNSKSFTDKGKIQLNLNKNPINCNCKLFDFLKYLNLIPTSELQNRLKIKTDSLTCSSPRSLANVQVSTIEPKLLTCPVTTLDNETCIYEQRLWDKSLIVNCKNKDFSEVPKIHIGDNFEQIEINLERNLLTAGLIESLDYENVSKLFLSSNNIEMLVWIPPKLRILELHDNNVSQLNDDVLSQLKSSPITHLTLGNNPWKCDCSSVNLHAFLTKNLDRMHIDTAKITCKDTNKILLHLTINDFCPDYFIITMSSSIVFTVIFFSTIIVLYYSNQYKIKVWLFAHNMCLWWVTEEELDKEKSYDAFISYSHKDEDFIINQLLPVLENGPTPYRVCLHIRDWTPGEFISKQIVQSVMDSRRTIVILSKNFLESVWGKMEFRTAHSQAMSEGRARVIIIMYGDVDIDSDLDEELKVYIKTNTYIKWNDPWFWDKLRYALPHLHP